MGRRFRRGSPCNEMYSHSRLADIFGKWLIIDQLAAGEDDPHSVDRDIDFGGNEEFEVGNFHVLIDSELVDLVGQQLHSDDEWLWIILRDDWLAH